MNCVIFGYGYMGQIRRRVLREHPDVGAIFIVEPGPNRAKVKAGATLLPSADEVPWETIDASFICTPNHVTADLCVDALRHCGSVFCEKPPGRDWADFCRIAEAAAGLPDHRLVFGFNHRLHPLIESAKAMIGEGGLGDVLYLKGTYGKSGGARYRESWRNNPALSGGGILLDQGIHMLDIFQVFLGELTLRDAVLCDSFWNCGVEDNAFILLESAKGVPAFLHSSATLWKHTFRIEIGCTNGYLVGSGLLSQTGSYGRERLVIGRRQFEDEALALGNPREEIVHFDKDQSWDREISEFLAAVKEGRPAMHGTLEEARRVMAIVRDAYVISGREVGIGRV